MSTVVHSFRGFEKPQLARIINPGEPAGITLVHPDYEVGKFVMILCAKSNNFTAVLATDAPRDRLLADSEEEWTETVLQELGKPSEPVRLTAHDPPYTCELEGGESEGRFGLIVRHCAAVVWRVQASRN